MARTPIFNSVKMPKVGSNVFDLTHDRKLSTNFGKLVPIMVMDCVPGDQVTIQTSVMMRLAPLITPVMHRASVYCHFFFVPNRIIWPGWEDFITGGLDGEDATVWPFISWDPDSASGSLGDHLGLPTDMPGSADNINVSALPFAAYQRIYQEYYMDQNLIADAPVDLADGDNSVIVNYLTEMRIRSWQHDYFTSALPWTQKGPDALLPVTGEASIVARTATAMDPLYQLVNRSDGSIQSNPGRLAFATATPPASISDVDDENAWIDLNDTHYTLLDGAVQTTINDLRASIALQQWLEINARGGSRYIESIKAHFGVNSSDARLQRPEFLGGSVQPIKISEVLQTSSTDETTPQANMAGHGISLGSGKYVSKYCEEHGYIIGIMSVMPESQYFQGVPRHFSRSDKHDYFWPSFAHLGEQAILNKEIYCTIAGEDGNEGVFGYTPRYAEYRFINNSVHGDMRTTLTDWHMARIFATQPQLNQDFIEMDEEEVDRIFAVETGDPLWCHVLNEVKARRKMPIYATPGLIRL